MTKLKIGLVQMRCEKAALDENLEETSRHIQAAADRRIDILGFPEMSVTGYADPIKYPQAIIRGLTRREILL